MQLAIEAFAFKLVLKVVEHVIGVGYAVGRVVITRSIEGVVQVFQLNDADVARRLHHVVVHRARLLTRRHEVVTLVGIVKRCAERKVVHLMASPSRERVLIVAVGIGGYDTILAYLRQAKEEVAHVCCAVKRHAVAISIARVEEVAHIVFYWHITLKVLCAFVNRSVTQPRTIKARSPRTVLVVGLVAIPTHTKVVLHLRQAQQRFPLHASVILYAQSPLGFLTRLGGDKDNTVGGSATIQGRCGCSFKDGHALHVVGIYGTCAVTKVVTAVQSVATHHRIVGQWHAIDNI